MPIAGVTLKRCAAIAVGVLALLAWSAVAQAQPSIALPNASRARLILQEQRNSPSEPWFTSEVVVRARWNNDAFSGVRAAMGLDNSRYGLTLRLARATEDRALALLSWVINDGWAKSQAWPGGPVASATVVGERGSVGFVFAPNGSLRLRIGLMPERPIEHWFGYDLWLDFDNPPGTFARVTMQGCRLRKATALSRRWVCPRWWW